MTLYDDVITARHAALITCNDHRPVRLEDLHKENSKITVVKVLPKYVRQRYTALKKRFLLTQSSKMRYVLLHFGPPRIPITMNLCSEEGGGGGTAILQPPRTPLGGGGVIKEVEIFLVDSWYRNNCS